MTEAAEDQGHVRKIQRRLENDTETPPRKRPWANKQWSAMSDTDKQALREHLQTFNNTEGQVTYLKYLRDWCEVPYDWLGIHPKN